MIYADTDFFIALAQEDDRLRSRAQELYEEHKDEITTSQATVIETAIVSWKNDADTERWIGSVFKIADVEGITPEQGMEAAHHIEKGVNVFDAFHAVLSEDKKVLSSDEVYDELGKERISLEG